MHGMYQVGMVMVLHTMDLAVGLAAAARKKDIKSAKLRDGLFKKSGFLFCYLLAWYIDYYGKQIGFTVAASILPVAICYGVLTEVVSIIENLHELNPDLIPDKLMEMFHVKQ